MAIDSTARFRQPAGYFSAGRVFEPNQAKHLDICESTGFDNVSLLEDNIPAQREYRADCGALQELRNKDVFQFWRSTEARFPALSVVALRCLAVPVYSVGDEPSFSACKNVLGDNRRRINNKLSKYNLSDQNGHTLQKGLEQK
ncbi:metastasis-associated protein MTA3 [Platysternon megacephalum]|uniref:Metastasis-associated protein MTA3 n=1 Tax=Platysternon megacephalum TaxID=55544 RepID=A0A4D9E8M3_9SAUR|nr:metastasis-associated protein MTA3 [Platysternon megacephalum]